MLPLLNFIFNEFTFLTVSVWIHKQFAVIRALSSTKKLKIVGFADILCEALEMIFYIGHDNNTMAHTNMYITASRMINDKTDIYDIHM